jgi:hypothetical protein
MGPQPANRTPSEAARNASISTKLNFSAPSTLIIHPQLARSHSFRLLLRWTRVALAREANVQLCFLGLSSHAKKQYREDVHRAAWELDFTVPPRRVVRSEAKTHLYILFTAESTSHCAIP